MLPNIHPELLAKKRGSKGKLEAIITPPPAKKAKSPSQKKPVSKKAGGKKGARKSKVCGLSGVRRVGQGCWVLRGPLTAKGLSHRWGRKLWGRHVAGLYSGASPAQAAGVWTQEGLAPVGEGSLRRALGQIAPDWKDLMPVLPGRCPHLWEGACVCRSFPVLGTASTKSCPECQLPACS